MSGRTELTRETALEIWKERGGVGGRGKLRQPSSVARSRPSRLRARTTPYWALLMPSSLLKVLFSGEMDCSGP